MKTLYLLTSLLLSLLCFENAYSQSYENQSPEVQIKMDENKIIGLPIWSGINFTYTVHTLGVDEAGVKTILNRAELVEDIISINYIDNGVFQLDCIGGTKFDIVKPIFSEIVTDIYKIEEKSYIQ